MANDKPKETLPKQEKFEIKSAEVPRRGLKVKVSGGNVDQQKDEVKTSVVEEK